MTIRSVNTRNRRRSLLIATALMSGMVVLLGLGGQALASPNSHAVAGQHLSAQLNPAERAHLSGTAVPAAPTRHCKATGYWTTCFDKATICWGDSPVWGSHNGSFSCTNEGWVSMSARWKYRTPHNRKVWELGGSPYCSFFAYGYVGYKFHIHISSCKFRNNGHPILTIMAKFTYSDPVGNSGSGYLAMYAHYDGTITLYGSWPN